MYSVIPEHMTEAYRKYLLTIRQTLLMQLAAIEELLGLERSVPSKRKQ